VLVVIGGWRLMVIAGCGGWSRRMAAVAVAAATVASAARPVRLALEDCGLAGPCF